MIYIIYLAVALLVLYVGNRAIKRSYIMGIEVGFKAGVNETITYIEEETKKRNVRGLTA